MINTNATNFRKNLFDFLNQTTKYNDIINVTTKNGNVVVLSEDDWRAIEETLHLYSIPGMAESIKEADKEPLKDAMPLDEVDW